ncbi:MAG: LysE family transporter [Christensenellales bacterium]|jgi:threonine/homoserine/homoserine lactone efflux protein
MELFLSALAIGFSGAIMPGPLLTYTIRRSLSDGPRAGFIIAAGHAVLELALIAFIFFGFDMVLQSGAAQTGISLVGGGLLIFMGIKMILDATRNRVTVAADTDGAKSRGMFLSGIVISAANPYFLFWWAVIGLGYITRAYDSLGFIGVPVYYFGHIAADFIWYGLVSVVVGTTRRFIGLKPYRIIIALLGGVLVFFGGTFVYDAAARLIG